LGGQVLTVIIRRSPIGFSILVLSIAGSLWLLHQAGLWR